MPTVEWNLQAWFGAVLPRIPCLPADRHHSGDRTWVRQVDKPPEESCRTFDRRRPRGEMYQRLPGKVRERVDHYQTLTTASRLP
jgi:hypothetical protein